MKSPQIALQLYSVRENCSQDFLKTLEKVAEIGYDGVEFAGYYGRSPQELRKLLDDLGLKVAGSHVHINTLLGGELEKSVLFNRVLDNCYLIVPSLPEEMQKTKDSWLEAAQVLNNISVKLRKKDLYVGYHNHAVEFQPINGELPWDILFTSTNPEVIMQLDTGNAMLGGVNPNEILKIIKRYPGRSKTVHLKEYSSFNEEAVIGEGDMKWREFLRTCESIGGTEWYIVEHEKCGTQPIECVELCYKNLRKILK